jgi:hypothetical protein
MGRDKLHCKLRGSAGMKGNRPRLVALIALPFLAEVPNKFLFQAEESALLKAVGLPSQALYVVVIAEAVFGSMLLVGYPPRSPLRDC